MRFAVVLVFAVASGRAAAPTFRLPASVEPVRYELELTVAPSEPAFHGSVKIAARVKQAVDEIWLNAKDLVIEQASVETGGGARRVPFQAAGEFLALRSGRVEPGDVRIEILYRGRLNEQVNEGIYRKQDGGAWYAYTTFTPIEARRAIPCFDEPGYKARWKVTLHVPKEDTAASNARAAGERAETGGMKRVEFAETQPLASEVLAFVVGPFDVVDAGVAGARRVPVRVLVPRGHAAEAAAAIAAGPAVIAQLEDYTGIPYPWEKLDHVAIADMPYGAVENPGLITYRAGALLTTAARDNPERRHAVRQLIAHELAHQWFGNLVTQAWWDDVWLSEGFATWLETKLEDQQLPAWQQHLRATASRVKTMSRDERPVRLAMNSRADMAKVYDSFVYNKGAAVLNMLEQWLGEAAFQRSLRRYLNDHANANATTADLALAIRAELGTDAAPVLHAFLDQAGVPVVQAAKGCVYEQAAPARWTIPLCVKQAGCAMAGANRVPFGSCPGAAWPNRDGSGYFRTRASAEVIDPLVINEWPKLAPAERLSIVADVAAMLQAKELAPAQALRWLAVMANDPRAEVAAEAYRVWLRLLANAAPGDRDAIADTARRVAH